nr:PREDICTED: uncharacterized protein C7orf26 homolog isoform X1 [Bemisia tabaci]
MSVDLKHSLRKLEFPTCVREALNQLEGLCASQSVGRVNIKQADLAMEIIAEFVFCETDRGRAKKQKLTCIQQLQLLEVLSDYFSYLSNGHESARNTVFMLLFPTTHLERAGILVKFVSMAIAIKNHQVLASTGIVMQQVGCGSKFSADLAEGLVEDYFILLPKVQAMLDDLPVTAPLFTANLLTALTELYGSIDKSAVPENLVALITKWLTEHPSLCYTAIITNLQPALPLGGIPMPALTPYVGLLKWCICCPLNNNTSSLYSQLHLALLQSLEESFHSELIPQPRNIIPVQILSSFIPILVNKVKQLSKQHPNDSEVEKNIQLSLDRLAQAIQVALATESLFGNKEDLLNRLEVLAKRNRLLEIVLKTHQTKSFTIETPFVYV